MFCIYCGEELPENASFCVKCGKEVLKRAKKEETAPVTEPEATVEQTAEEAICEDVTETVAQTETEAGAETETTVLEEPVCEEKAESKAKKKNAALPVLIMAAALVLIGVISAVSALNLKSLSAIKEYGDAFAVRSHYMVIAVNVGHILIQYLIGAVLFAGVCLIRKNHLHKIKMKDVIPACLFILTPFILSMLSNNYTVMAGYALGERYLAAISAASGVLSLVTLSSLVAWIGLCIFVLARTGAKILSLIIGIAVVGISFVGSVLLAIFAPAAIRLMGASSDIMYIAMQYLRINAMVAFIPVFVDLFFWWAWGSGKMWFVPACIYGPMYAVLNSVLGIAGAYLSIYVWSIGIAYMGLGSTLAYILCGGYILLFTIIGLVVELARKKKQTA